MMFLYVETPLHAGTGRALGTVDLPIQRERATGYPMIQASGIKGRLRAHYENTMNDDDFFAVFGPKTENAADYAGALSFGDARLLLFPVRSLAGVFTWTTSVDALSRFAREVALTGVKLDINLPKDKKNNLISPQDDKAWVSGGRNKIPVNGKDKIVLEEFAFEVENIDISTIAVELAKALPDGKEFDYWRQTLSESLCILPEDAFRDFTLYATEVQTHIKLNPDKKTVENGALWTAESLPIDTVLYVPLVAQKSRYDKNELSPDQVLKKITAPDANDKHKGITRINFGGDETTGQGYVAVKFMGGQA
jgi:CRISPR-associated protein Cmr4